MICSVHGSLEKRLTSMVLSIACLAITAQAGSASASATCLVDTRNSKVASLAIVGSSTCAPGGSESYRCYASFLDGTIADVSAVCDWWIDGAALSDTSIYNGKFTAGIPALPMSVGLKAGYKRLDGYVVSPSFFVSIAQGLSIKLGLPSVINAGDGAWDLNVSASVFGASGDTQFQWTLDGNVLSIAGSSLSSYRVIGAARTISLSLLVSDSAGKQVSVSQKIVLNKTAVVNEPLTIPLQSDPANGHILDSDGEPLSLDPAKASVGLIVLTHGFRSNGKEEWLKTLCGFSAARLLHEDKPMPNICIYDWGEVSSPLKLVYNNEPDKNASWFKRFKSSWIIQKMALSDLADLLAIHPIAVDQGKYLADWIQQQVSSGTISSSAPIHLIGHSAGGFVVSECAFRLKERGVITGDIQYTTLDSPVLLPSDRVWFNLSENLGGSCRMERFDVVNGLGGLGCLFTWPADGPGYYRRRVFDFLNLGVIEAHAFAHEWYEDTTFQGVAETESDGFYYSPFLNNGFHGLTGGGGSWSMMSFPPATALSDLSPDAPITDFEIFGNVSETSGCYRILEQANAGFFKMLELPIGTQTVGFRYRFTVPGDGDYLCVSWSSNSTPLFIGSDMGMSRSGWVNAVVSLAEFAGETNNLIFKLVSRGETNAVVEIEGIVLTQTEDADNDGLTNDAELALGTNPLNWDSDGDGIDDFYEIHTSLTDPLRPDSDYDGARDDAELDAGTDPNDPTSCFKISSIQSVLDGRFVVRWNGKAGRKYRVHRSMDLAQRGYETIATGIPGIEPITAFTNNVENVSSIISGFFWVEME